ncbi:AAA family ATPase [Ferrimicrobium acidiphilum]|uniref:AAA family ATPase n=1 Tax=Ferrimicrobium acidiphilum TaxID=121039 RepID=UPI0023F2F49F|nr:AAA family ATPase [Ferrimicrobium acidiphilum]
MMNEIEKLQYQRWLNNSAARQQERERIARERRMPPEKIALGIARSLGMSVILWGEPGSGKSFVVEQMAKDMNVPFAEVILAQTEATDLGGIPVARWNPSGQPEMQRMPFEGVKEVLAAQKGIIFLDEINVDESKLGVAQNIFSSRRISGVPLGPDVWIVGAANPMETNRGVCGLTPAMARRFIHIDWSPTVVEDEILGLVPPREVPIFEVRPDWKQSVEFQVAKAKVNDFLAEHQQLKWAKNDDLEDNRGWPLPAAWERVIAIETACDLLGITRLDAKHILLSGSVGNRAADTYVSWSGERELLDPELILENPALMKEIGTTRHDRVIITGVRLVKAVQNELTTERVLAATSALNQWAELDGAAEDIILPAIKDLIRIAPTQVKQRILDESPNIKEFAKVVRNIPAGTTTGFVAKPLTNAPTIRI